MFMAQSALMAQGCILVAKHTKLYMLNVQLCVCQSYINESVLFCSLTKRGRYFVSFGVVVSA